MKKTLTTDEFLVELRELLNLSDLSITNEENGISIKNAYSDRILYTFEDILDKNSITRCIESDYYFTSSLKIPYETLFMGQKILVLKSKGWIAMDLSGDVFWYSGKPRVSEAKGMHDAVNDENNSYKWIGKMNDVFDIEHVWKDSCMYYEIKEMEND